MADFWDSEYAEGGALGGARFDWLFDFEHLPAARWRELLGASTNRVLAVGCGHAALSRRVA